MSEPFISEIRMFPYMFTPRNWARCDGQAVPIAQNSTLFALIGIMYGGNGRTSFKLPKLLGRTPMHAGAGPGLTPRRNGQQYGQTVINLKSSELPAHTHTTYTEFEFSEQENPTNNVLGVLQDPGNIGRFIYTEDTDTTTTTTAAFDFLKPAGQSSAHENQQPYLIMPFFIALAGIFPSRPVSN